jgi:cytochrome c oxidase subunit II
MLTHFSLFPQEASTVAPDVDALFLFIAAVSAFFAVLIAVTIIYFAIKYRRRSQDEVPPAIHGSLRLELIWTIIPFAIAMVIFAWGANVYLKISRPPDDSLEVFVVAKQWMWKLQHLEGRREINELHVPLGRPVKLTMTSEDVIHSFFVPAFRIKADVVPGRYTTTWFQATKTGSYHLFCAEYCGTEHAGMIGRVVVMDPADYQTWLSGGGQATNVGAAGPAKSGEALFQKYGCVTCHRAGGSGGLGPSLIGLYGSHVKLKDGETVYADAGYIRESILNPKAKIVAGYLPVMPTFKGQIPEENLLQLIQYVKSLGKESGAEAHGAAEQAPSDRAM